VIIDTIVTDMDGTLLGSDRKLSQYTLQILKECMSRGIRLIPASGRTHPSMRPYLEQLQTGMPYIAGNGSEIISADHRVLRQMALDVETQKEICTFLQNEGFYVQVYDDQGFYFAEECSQAERYRRSSGMKGTAVGDLVSFLHFPTPKILTVNDPSEVQRMLPVVNQKFQGRATFTVSEINFLEAEPIGASKGEALAELAKMRGDIIPERTIAFGDGLNDLSMLAFTPNSVAMGNAREELKRHAAYVCRSNAEDGLAHFVAEHVLGWKEENH